MIHKLSLRLTNFVELARNQDGFNWSRTMACGLYARLPATPDGQQMSTHAEIGEAGHKNFNARR